MTNLVFTGTNSFFLGEAFFDSNDSQDSQDIISTSSTELVLLNTDTGITTTVTGTGFTYNSEGPTGGTITGAVFEQSGQVQATLSDISWSIVAFANALDAVEASDNTQPLMNLINSSGTLTVDYSDAQADVDMVGLFDYDMLEQITVSMHVIGPDNFQSKLDTGWGNDTVTIGSSPTGFEYYASQGTDTIDFTNGDTSNYGWVDYWKIGPVTFNIDGSANTATVTGNNSSDTWTNVNNVLIPGLSIAGSSEDDTLNITLVNGQWLSFRPKDGEDTINATLDEATLRLEYHRVDGEDAPAPINANIGEGWVIDPDGNTDTLDITTIGRGRLDIRATDFADTLIGHDGRDGFIGRAGNDTMDGMGGFDRLRLDRSQYDGPVMVDFEAGTATGTFEGNAFTYTLRNIEMVQATDGDDTLSGSRTVNDWFSGNGGDDMINGRDGLEDGVYTHVDRADATLTALADLSGLVVSSSEGDDTITSVEILEFRDESFMLSDLFTGQDVSGGGADEDLMGTLGDDTLSGVNGDDTLTGGMGDDLIRGGKDDDVLYGGAGEDILRGQSHGDVLYGGEDDDNVKGGGGNDTLYGDSGNDFLKGGSRKDVVYGGEGNDKLFGNSFDDTLDGGDGNDKLNAGGENDILIGGAGDDTLKGGAGEDVFVFDTGHGDDLVNDFDAGDDTLQLSAALADGASAADIAASATVTGDGVLIEFGDSSILLRGLTATTGLEGAIDIV